MSHTSIPFILESHKLPADKHQALLALFPEIHTEGGKVDLDRLKLVLGDTVDSGRERYGLTWPGKTECFKTIQTPSTATLCPCPAESINFDTTENLIIEGDNLEVLKLLQKAYLGKVKMIYIDPPYNTGNDFIYPDNYTESLQTYLEYTSQVDSEGRKFSTNSDTDGRFHSKWLNMMYPRLYLARNLLTDDGVIFISIDDHERDNLKLVCNEIFGEENSIGCFVWQSKKGGGSDSNSVVADHEYVIAYGKSENERGISKISIDAEVLDKKDEKGMYRRGRELNKWGANSRREDRPTMWFPIPGPGGIDVFPIRNDGTEGRWRWGKKNMLAIVEKGDVEFVMRENGTYIAYEKIRRTDQRVKPFRTFLTDMKTTADGSKEVKYLFNDKKVFDFPKPTDLIKRLLEIGSPNEDDIILDFFAGAGTTAQAVLECNRDENSERKFIVVQLPEPSAKESEALKAGYEKISKLMIERIRRVINRLNDVEIGQLDLTNEDRGFRVFKLAESNFNAWNAQVPHDPTALARQLELHIEHLRPGRTSADILYELLLKSGYPLTTPVEEITLAGQPVYRVAEGLMLVCLERNLTLEVLRAMADLQPERVVCLDTGFADDALKTNAVQIFKTKGIVFRTV